MHKDFIGSRFLEILVKQERNTRILEYQDVQRSHFSKEDAQGSQSIKISRDLSLARKMRQDFRVSRFLEISVKQGRCTRILEYQDVQRSQLSKEDAQGFQRINIFRDLSLARKMHKDFRVSRCLEISVKQGRWTRILKYQDVQ